MSIQQYRGEDHDGGGKNYSCKIVQKSNQIDDSVANHSFAWQD